MMKRTILLSLIVYAVIGSLVMPAATLSEPGENEILQAMQKTTDFMMNKVSYRGGFVWYYSADLSEQWGEVPARKTMIWVQNPGTVGVGMILLEAFKVTGDKRYLEYAEKAANALVWGQHPEGGWDYYIDFEPTGIQNWYDTVLSKCWLWEEFYHYYGNCTYDDNVTTAATQFLLNIYVTTLDPRYKTPLIKALNFILESQYPNGAWPQRYPLKYDFSFPGHPDYTSYYTYNDGVTINNIYLMLEAWEKLGDEAYRKSAIRGMDFVIISQVALPQAGWSDQYDTLMRPAQARTYEPQAICCGTTVGCIRDLENFYKITGDRRYLKGIPDALSWLENSYIPESHKIESRITHASFYELGTNKPLYVHCKGTGVEDGQVWVDYEPGNFMPGYGFQTVVDLPVLKREYQRVSSLTPEQAQAEYQSKKLASIPQKTDNETIKNIIRSLDNRGAWVEEISIDNFLDYVNKPPRTLKGIRTSTYIGNMQRLLSYIRNLER